MFFKDDDKHTGQESTRLWFKVVYVFDLSQTDGASLPDLPCDCFRDGEEFASRLLDFAASSGIQVRSAPLRWTLRATPTRRGQQLSLTTPFHLLIVLPC